MGVFRNGCFRNGVEPSFCNSVALTGQKLYHFTLKMMTPTECMRSYISASWVEDEIEGSIRDLAGTDNNQDSKNGSGTHTQEGSDNSPEITPVEAFNAVTVEGEGLLSDMHGAAIVYPNTFDKFLNNMDLNRIPHLYCYDHNRVVVTGKHGSGDYYHASFVDGYNKNSAYIFAQAPFDDASESVFWRMVVDQKPSMILVFGGIDEKQKRKQPHNIADKSFEKTFLAEFGASKLEDVDLKAQINRQFWPEKGKNNEYGHVAVKSIDEHSEPHMKTYTLAVKEDGETRPSVLMHFNEWGKDGVDEMPEFMLDMRASIKVQFVRSSKKKDAFAGPIMLVCATGVFKCMTYAMVDIVASRITEEHTVGFKETISALKSQRYGRFTEPPLKTARNMLMKFAVSTGCVHEDAIGDKPTPKPKKGRSMAKSTRITKKMKNMKMKKK